MIRPVVLLAPIPLLLGACLVDDPSWEEGSDDGEGLAELLPEQRLVEQPICELEPYLHENGDSTIDGNYVDPCEPPPPPSYPPSTPSSISYGVYKTGTSYTVSWDSSYGDGTYLYYEVDEQRNGSTWLNVYQGPYQSAFLSNKTAAVYRYRVRACNDAGCSSYQYGNDMVVNTPPVMDLYSQYPFLYTHDQQNAAYRASQPSLRGEFTQSSSSGGQLRDFIAGNFNLGQGFNLLKDTYAGICIDTARPGLGIVTNSNLRTEYNSERVVTVSQLFQLMDVSMDAGLSFDGEGYSAGFSGSKKRFTESVMDEYHEVIVVRWRREAQQWTLNTSVDPLKPEFVSSMLIPNNANAQAAFREVCGDKYIYGADLGASLYMVFTFDSKSYSATERQQKAASLELAIDGLLSANGGGTASQETRTLLQQLNVTVKAYQVGGPPIGTVTRDNFGDVFQAFVTGVGSSNYAAVRHHMRHYDHPTQYLNYGYFQIFADYRDRLAQVRRWNVIDAERERRCDLLTAYGLTTTASKCPAAKADIETAKSLCVETLSWSGCVHPVSYVTPGYDPNNPGSLPANISLYNWLRTNISDLDETIQSSTGDYHVNDGSIFRKECRDIDHFTCLPAGCVEDKFKGYGAGTGKGFGLQEYYWDCPGSGGFRYHSMVANNGARCAYTDARICTSLAGDSTADYEFYHEVFGQCPVARDFPIVN